jgi:putative transposase
MHEPEHLKIHRAFRYRIYPTVEQCAALAIQFGHSRFVYNHFLSVRKENYQQTKKALSYNDTAKMLTALKRDGEHDWLREANAQVLQQKLMDLQQAYVNFFEGRTKYPTLKKKRNHQSIRYPQDFELRTEKRVIYLSKVGDVQIVLHRPIQGKPKSITVSKTSSGNYFVSILCEVPVPAPTPRDLAAVGIDLGLLHFVTLSTGEKIKSPKPLRQSEAKIKRLQRELARRKLGSNSREKTRLKLAKQHEKLANQRRDFLHKISFRLVQNFSVIRMEKLNVVGMMHNHVLAKSISDASWGLFNEILAYKSQWYGTRVEHVNRFFPSSKMCHVCQSINDNLKLSDRLWVCSKCHTEHDRDLNAALNIKNYDGSKLGQGLVRSHAEGDCVRPTAKSRRAAGR